MCWGSLLRFHNDTRGWTIEDIQTPTCPAYDQSHERRDSWSHTAVPAALCQGSACMHTDMPYPFTRFGLLTTKDLERMFNVSDDTITRAYKRGDIPRPIVLFGKHVWTVEAIQRHLVQRMEAARLQVEREQVQRETKMQNLYKGKPYGRRP